MKLTRVRPLRAVGALAALLLVVPGLAACGGGDDEQQELTVFGAASLTEAFTTLAGDFEKDHPDVDVKLSFGSSTDLATQVNEGSPADVLATADEKSMSVAADEGNIDGDPAQFATNTLIVVTPPDNPADVTSLDDLADADFVVCDQSVPCGAGQTEARLMTLARAEPPAPSMAVPTPSGAAVVPTARSPGKMWPPRRTLMLGMSDDEVLNLAGWGVPKRITRTKGPREWREEWFYPTSTGERRLSFVNATLVDAVVDAEASQAVTQVAIERRTYPAS